MLHARKNNLYDFINDFIRLLNVVVRSGDLVVTLQNLKSKYQKL